MSGSDDMKTELIDKPQISRRTNLKDPLLVSDTEMGADVYSLTWTSLKIETWEHMTLRDVPINLNSTDIYNLTFHFLFFLLLILFSVIILIYDIITTDVYIVATWTIITLRVLMCIFAQKKLAPEFNQALTIIFYTHMRPQEFTHPTFALLVGFCQLTVTSVVYVVIMMSICLQDESMGLVMDFAGLAVITELDNWIGEMIMQDKPHDPKENQKNNHMYNCENLNEKMGLFDKISMIDEEMLIIRDDRNYAFSPNPIFQLLSWVLYNFPWILVPFSVLLIEWQMMIHHTAKDGK